MTEPRDRALAAYRAHFGEEPALLVRAPGRVNLIGEHTDYNDGFVLPCAIGFETVVAAGPASDGLITAIAADYRDAIDRFDPARGFESTGGEWSDYVRGTATALADAGFSSGAARLAIAGDVPQGSGLASSASLEVAVGGALADIAGHTIDRTALAKIGQDAENRYVGCACGIMDQLISALGVAGHALLIDCRSLEIRAVALAGDIAVVIAHSGVRHAHAGGKYNDRRAQCEQAARHYDVAALRDLDLGTLEAHKAGLNDVAHRRARHIVSENARTLDAATALERGDLATLGRLMQASHASMRDDFEITVPDVDRLAEIMHDAIGGAGGARMTGGGFGGCVVGVTSGDRVDAVRVAVEEQYRAPDGHIVDVLVCRAANGISRLDLPDA